MSSGPKVFCIGFHKTGTTSLALALRQLGYSVTGPNGVNDPNIAENVHQMAHALVEKYDAFQDNPWPLLYKDLDARYPHSKFVLTVRPTDAWIRSQVRHFGTDETPMRKWIYGVGAPEGNESLYVERYETHNREVLSHFKDRPTDLLVMNLGAGYSWEKLCAFLEKPIPAEPFPHANKSEDREKRNRLGRRLLHRLAKIGRN